MFIIQFLIELFGTIYLLIYGIKIVQSGVERSFGYAIRGYLLSKHRQGIYALIGMLMAILFQSGLAASIFTVSFLGAGFLTSISALAIVIGADFGSAISAFILSLNFNFLMPLLLFFGGWAYLRSKQNSIKYFGKILFGIALILLSIEMLKANMLPISESGALSQFANILNRDLITIFILGIFLTIVLHSSIAALLMGNVAVLSGAIQFSAGFSFVLGVNFGAGFLLVWVLRHKETKELIVPVANFALRGSIALLFLGILGFGWLPTEVFSHWSILAVHIAFNALILPFVLMAKPLLDLVNSIVLAIYPNEVSPQMQVNYLELELLANPRAALVATKRELLRMSEIVETMAQIMMKNYLNFSERDENQILGLDTKLNDTLRNIRNYVSDIPFEKMTKSERRAARRMVDVAIDLEAAGDVISKRLARYSRIIYEENSQFSEEGKREIKEFFLRVLSNLPKNFSLILSEDPDVAQGIVEEKSKLRALEAKSRKAHFKRLQSHDLASFGSSDMHLETLSALRELNSKTSAFAYAILESHGQLLTTRLKAK